MVKSVKSKDAKATGTALGIRLRTARESAGLSTRAAATRVKALGLQISHASIRNYETGSFPTAELLDALAQAYGCTPDWLLGDGPMVSNVRYRCLKSVRVGDKRRFEGEAVRWFEAYLRVERILERRPKYLRVTVHADDEPAKLAERIRKIAGFGDQPVPSVTRLLEKFGIRVIQLHSTARIDGFAGWLGDVPIVALNGALPNDRIRLNAAHELAHHLYEDCSDAAEHSEADIERRAFECASHLLLPERVLQEAFDLQSMVRLVQFKERYGISLAAMIYRARNSRLLRQKVYERLWRDFSRLGWRRDEPGTVAPDRPRRMEALFDAAIGQKLATYLEIASWACVDERAVRRRVFDAIGTATGKSDLEGWRIDPTIAPKPVGWRSTSS